MATTNSALSRSLPTTAAPAAAVGGLWPTWLLAAAAWAAAAAFIAWFPVRSVSFDVPSGRVVVVAIGLAVLAGLLGLIGDRLPAVASLRPLGPWFIALAGVIAGWEAVTAKLTLLPRPFFVSPQAVFDVYFLDWPRLSESLLHSLRLLGFGYVTGVLIGFTVGVAIGWWRGAGYWLHPVLRFIGPLPATAWLPIAFFLFPTSMSASVFLIALAAGVPVTILTWSGVASVNKDYYDMARTLGANESFLVRKVAIPAAMPHVFVGLFMGLSAAFAVLVVAEMLGVKAGLGWYLQWAQGWASYANMYAALLLMAVMCSGLVTLLFWSRDRALAWQKDLVRW